MSSLSARLGHDKLNKLVEKIEIVINTRMKGIDKVPSSVSIPERPKAGSLAARELEAACIRAYFHQMHPIYPFLDRRSFEERAFNPGLANMLANDKAWCALYHAVLAIGSQYCDGGSFEPGKGQAWDFFEVALSLFPDLLLPRGSLMIVQAVTAMAIYALNVSCLQIEYVMVSEGARMAQALGYHRVTGSSEGVCHRTFWVLYSLEKTTCFHAGRSSVLMDADIGCPIPFVPEASFGNLDWFLAFARYSRLVSQIYNLLFSISSTGNSAKVYYTRVDQLGEELERWRMSIPEEFRPDEIFRARALPEALGVAIALRLQYFYYNALLSLCRTTLHVSSEDNYGAVRQQESRRLLMKTARSILELTKYVEVETYTPLWILVVMPLSALFILFDLVVHNPTHPETNNNLALLDVASGHFSRLEYASSGSLPGSLVAEFAHIARQYVRDIQLAEYAKENSGAADMATGGSTTPSGMSAMTPQRMDPATGFGINQAQFPLPSPPGGLFFPMIDDPNYMPDGGFPMGIDVMNLFDLAIPGLDPTFDSQALMAPPPPPLPPPRPPQQQQQQQPTQASQPQQGP
ncbi:MAG: hypothetical protein M1819_003375 [Sarea resinae]|nr:MAG: hypothetical protein M1819_003375 [Sarea resinae]